MKKFYIVYTCDYINEPALFGQKDKSKKYFANVIKVSEFDNLQSRLDSIGGLVHANIAPTKKAAYEIADNWNERYKKNGTYFK